MGSYSEAYRSKRSHNFHFIISVQTYLAATPNKLPLTKPINVSKFFLFNPTKSTFTAADTLLESL